MTKKELVDILDNLPDDAEIEFYHYKIGYAKVYQAHYNEELKKIELC